MQQIPSAVLDNHPCKGCITAAVAFEKLCKAMPHDRTHMWGLDAELWAHMASPIGAVAKNTDVETLC
jgi:hypothetical protein